MTQGEEKIYQKLMELETTVAAYIAGSAECKKRCSKTHDAVFGNGGMGLRAKVWVIWGALGIGGTAIIALLGGLDLSRLFSR